MRAAPQRPRSGQRGHGAAQAADRRAAHKPGPRCASSCAATRACAAPACCGGWTAGAWTTCWACRRTPDCCNARRLAELALAEQYQARGTKQRLYGSFDYAADSWDRQRRVIARLEHGPQGANPRFIVTSLNGDARHLYDKRYCARGEAENRIKEAQLDLFGQARQLPPLLGQPASPAADRAGLHADDQPCAAMPWPAPSWPRRAPPPFASSCSRSQRPSCATPAVCACCWPPATRCAPSSPAPRTRWPRRSPPVLSPAR